MEPLIEIPRTKWSQLRDLYREHWPRGAVAYCLLDAQITYMKYSEVIGFKVYCPEGEMSNGVIAISEKEGYYQVYIHPLSGNIKIIEKTLLSTHLIDWTKIPVFPSADTDVKECIKKLCESQGFTFSQNISVAVKFILNKDSASFENLSNPPNTYVGPIKPKVLNLIDTTWTYHSKRSYEYFETLMKNDLSYVLYSLDDQPLAWINVDIETGALSHLYCLEPHRRKGYSEFIVKHAINDFLKKGKDVLTYAIEGNESATNLFKKLGFKNFGVDTWIYLEKNK